MPQNSEEGNNSITTLNRKRGGLKARVTNFKKFLTSTETPNLINVKSRLNEILKVKHEFEQIQLQIELYHIDTQTEPDPEREVFDNLYYETTSLAQYPVKCNRAPQIRSTAMIQFCPK